MEKIHSPVKKDSLFQRQREATLLDASRTLLRACEKLDALVESGQDLGGILHPVEKEVLRAARRYGSAIRACGGANIQLADEDRKEGSDHG